MQKSELQEERLDIVPLLRGIHVLIIDDDAESMRLLSYILRRAGIHVSEITNPDQTAALLLDAQCHYRPVPLIRIEVRMEHELGDKTARTISSLEFPLCNIPMIAVSSMNFRLSRKYDASLFNGFLSKPVRRARLLQLMKNLLIDHGLLAPLPLADGEEPALSRSLVSPKGGIHILLVEDNPINRKLAHHLLNKAGCQVTLAENGQQAIDRIRQEPDSFDLVFMDIQMPEMDGREATAEIRKMGLKSLPVVAMTAESMQVDRERCLEAGMNDYIAKPIKKEIVLRMIEKWVVSEQNRSDDSTLSQNEPDTRGDKQEQRPLP